MLFRKSGKTCPMPLQSDVFKAVAFSRDLFPLGGFFLC